ALDFIKQNKEFIKIILFTHKGSYFLTNYEKLPISNQLEKTILYLLAIKKTSKCWFFLRGRRRLLLS
ncbi:MAG: hypothetical protein VW583_08465, partial [Betaproteobacteria bacterium]